MPNGIKYLLLIVLICLFSTISYAQKEHPIVEKRKEFMQNMYLELCKEKPLSRYCLYTTASAISDTFFYDPYLTEDDFTIPSPALEKNMDYCNKVSNYDYNCNDGTWETTWTIAGTTTSTVYASGNLLVLSTAEYISSSATYLTNLKNKDIKTKLSFTADRCTHIDSISLHEFNIHLGSETVYSYSLSTTQPTPTPIPFLIEIIKDVTDSDKFVVLVNGEAIKEITILDDEAFLSYSVYTDKNACGTGGQSSTIYIDYLKSKPYFSCEVDSDEVVVRKRFGEGSTFNKDDLDCKNFKCEPTKYCPHDYPAVVRNYLARGVKSDVRGTIIYGLAKGEYFTVPQFHAYEIQWITTAVVGMQETCDPLLEYYDTNTDKCYEQGFLFEPACFIDSDCWIPPSCAGVTAQCVDGNCIYSGDCILPPTPGGEETIWDLIQNAWTNFWNWVRSIFS